ncbi:carbamoyltransferase family protein [Hufsiella ginkgonis]|uniref:Carbamoyltransferase n=1 Tax=Hufsiella ginkgonis TaxID=2695274 RepID=A0A7K1Y077_9SPHI|nr:carbamoyltransferase C-terminal domain-containing protein [Hufsiella ginkgonis]MXV16674.1 carbamoyltransferase [Hufsiella ginkgonis]
MYTLGINAAFHDSSACILKDGILLAAAEDERFTHFKHGKRPIPFAAYELPYHAINFCLEKAGIFLKDVDHIAYSFDPELLVDSRWTTVPGTVTVPFRKARQQPDGNSPWDPLFVSSIIQAPYHLVDGYPHHLQYRFNGCKTTDFEWHFVEHHISHAASAYFPSPFGHAAVLTLDGRGELATTTYNLGRGNDLERIGQVNMPNSLGLLYEQVTTHLGFLHSSDEYKVMALASYGKPGFVYEFRSMIRIGENGQYSIDSGKIEEYFGPKRLRNEEFTAYHFNIAHSLQVVLEDTVLELAAYLHRETRETNLCLAGGVALNCVLNARIRDRGPFRNIWVQPASGDSGTALGAAIWIDSKLRNSQTKDFVMEHVYWGPDYTDMEIERFLKLAKVPYRKLDNIAEETAGLLVQDKIIGWFQGKMEFGPRALGSRSILASPINPDMQSRLNVVKDREDFRPVAPVVLQEEAHAWFKGAGYSPFMLFVYDVLPGKEEQIPAVRHVDGTARIQTINERQHPEYYALLKAFYRRTGVPVLINTSFNTLGKPIVCSPRDAVECFWSSPFDALVIGSFLIQK